MQVSAVDLECIKFQLVTKQNWSLEKADHVEKMYRSFWSLCGRDDLGFAATPSLDVDEFWHTHILDTIKYAEDCANVFGKFINHYPYIGVLPGQEDSGLDDFEKTCHAVFEETGLYMGNEWKPETPIISYRGDGYMIRPLTGEEFGPLFKNHRPSVFRDNMYIDFTDMAVNTKPRGHDSSELYFGVFHGDQCIGWSFGRRTDRETFEMVNSCIFEGHRRVGLYSALLVYVMNEAKNRGYRVITSRHIMSNNAIIIAKLKAGFIITGFEVSDKHGTLVKMSYFFNEQRKKIIQFRTGEVRPDDALKTLFRI